MAHDETIATANGQTPEIQTGTAAKGTAALLRLSEVALSASVIFGLFQTPGIEDHLPDLLPSLTQAVALSPSDLAVLLAVLLAAAMTLLLTATLTLIDRGIARRLQPGRDTSSGMNRTSTRHAPGRLISAVVLTGLIAISAILLVDGETTSRARAAALAATIGAWGVTIATLRLALAPPHADRRILLLGTHPQQERMRDQLQSRRGRRFDVVTATTKTAPAALAWDSLRRQNIWAIVLMPSADAHATGTLLDAKMRGLRVVNGSTFLEQALGRIDLDSLTPQTLLTADGFAVSGSSDRLKRVCDVLIASLLLLLTAPLMALTALLITADSKGGVIYRQDRTGAFGRTFTVFKFRSMRADAEIGDNPRWAQVGDPRITRVGRFIRATRIDELPQLANILLGDMSLVGPRPERPHFVQQLSQAIPFYDQRSYVKPGLTGWAQVNYPYGASIQDAREKLAYDLYYLKHRSFWLDLRILLATVRVVLSREGAR